MKKILVLLMMIVLATGLSGCGNMQMLDTIYTFDYAYISLPNGECVEGKVQSWADYADSDQLQITIDGVAYFTDSTRAVLIRW